MDFTVRAPVLADADAIADLHVSAWQEAYTYLLPSDYFTDEYVEARHRMWSHVLANPRDDVTVRIAEIDRKIIGFVWAGPSLVDEKSNPPRQRQLYAIYIAAAHYGNGAGQALLDEALGSDPAMLWVAKENPRATAFYIRNGFQFDGVEQVDPYAPAITDSRMIR